MQQRGFSLLEVLVAFSILAISLGILMQIFSGSLTRATIAREQTEATLLAQSLLASEGIEQQLTDDVKQGTYDDRFRWEISTSLYANENATQAAGELWLTKVHVTWGDMHKDKGRLVTLTSLRFQPKSPP